VSADRQRATNLLRFLLVEVLMPVPPLRPDLNKLAATMREYAEARCEVVGDMHPIDAVEIYKWADELEAALSAAPQETQMTNAEIIIVREGLRALDCGALHCRYCDAGMPGWEHSRSCPYADSVRVVEQARKILDRVQASISAPDTKG
jgi:hypothetical protein